MNTKEFIEKVDNDKELQKKFEGITTPEKFYDVAKDNGLTDDFNTLKEEACKLLKEYSKYDEINLSSLKEISGGISTETSEKVIFGMATAASGSTILASAAAGA